MRTSDMIAARQPAREKALLANEQHQLNRQAEQAALGAFEFAHKRGDDTATAKTVLELVDLDNSVGDIASLTNQDPIKIHKLHKLTPPQRSH